MNSESATLGLKDNVFKPFKDKVCTDLAWDTRAGDGQKSLHDEPNDDLALLVGMEKLDQLFNVY